MFFRLILVAFMAWFITGCGGGGGSGNKDVTKTQQDSNNTSNVETKTVSGYVIDDPITGATIEVYDLNGTLLKKEENATDSSGKFSIVVDVDKENKYILKSIGGKLNKIPFQSTLINICGLNGKCYLTPYTTLVQFLKDSYSGTEEEKIQKAKNAISKYLGVAPYPFKNDNKEDIEAFRKIIGKDGSNLYAFIESFQADIVDGYIDNKPILQAFMNAKKREIIQYHVELPENNISTRLITNLLDNENVKETDSLIDVIALSQDNKLIGLPAKVSSLKGIINAETTAMAIVSLGMADYELSINNLEEIYKSIKNISSFKKLVEILENQIKDGAIDFKDFELQSELYEIYKHILSKKLIFFNKDIKDIDRNKSLKLTKKFLKKVEFFTYPYFTFKFDDISSKNYGGYTGFTIENPSYYGYAFTKKDIFLKKDGILSEISNLKDINYVSFSKIRDEVPKIKDFIDPKTRITCKKIGSSDHMDYKLSLNKKKRNDLEADYVDNFIAYNNFTLNVPTIYNSLYIMEGISTIIVNTKLSKKITPFINKIKELMEKKEDLKSAISTLDLTIEFNLELFEGVLNVINLVPMDKATKSNLVELKVSILQIQNKIKELKKIQSAIKNIMKNFDIHSLKVTEIERKGNNFPKELVDAIQKGNIINILDMSKKYNIGLKDIYSIVLGNLTTINYKGQECNIRSGCNFEKNDKTLVYSYIGWKLLSATFTKKLKKNKLVKTISNYLDNKVKSKKISFGFGSKEVKEVDAINAGVASTVGSINNILEMLNSWANKGFYIDYKSLEKTFSNIDKLFFDYLISQSDELIKGVGNGILTVLEGKEINTAIFKEASKSIAVIRESSNVAFNIGSYFANPHIVPYQITATKIKNQDKIKFDANFFLKSIGRSLVYALDEQNKIADIKDKYGQPQVILAKKDYLMSPSMELIFPRGILNEYFTKTLFSSFDYPYMFQSFISKDGTRPELSYSLVAKTEKNKDEDTEGLIENYKFSYAYLFGENDYYVDKSKAPKRLVDNIKTMNDTSTEFLDVYDLRNTLNTPFLLKRGINNEYLDFRNGKMLLKKTGMYNIKFRSIIGVPYIAYIKKEKPTLFNWEYNFKVVILDEIKESIENNKYSYYRWSKGNFLYFFQIGLQGLSEFNEDSENIMFAIPVVNNKIYSPINGKAETYISLGLTLPPDKIDVYFISKKNYNNIINSGYNIDTILLNKLVKNKIAYKKVLSVSNKPFKISKFSIENWEDTNEECLLTGKCIFAYDIDNIADNIYDLSKINIEIDFGDNNKTILHCKDTECQGTILHSYKGGKYSATIKVYDTSTNQEFDFKKYPSEIETYPPQFVIFPIKPIKISLDSNEITQVKAVGKENIEYSLYGEDSDYFVIDKNGVIRFSNEFNKENAKDSYTIKVIAHSGIYYTEQELTINIIKNSITSTIKKPQTIFPSKTTNGWTNSYEFAALKKDKSVVGWGKGDGDVISFEDVKDSLTDIKAIYSNSRAYAALSNNGKVITWGEKGAGGDSSIVENELTDVKSIYSTATAFAALKNNGEVITWGDKQNGGDSSKVNSDLKNIIAIYSTNGTFLAITKDRKLIGWGASSENYDFSTVSNVKKIYTTSLGFAIEKLDGSIVTWYEPQGGFANVYKIKEDAPVISFDKIYTINNSFIGLKSNGEVVTWSGVFKGEKSLKTYSELINIEKIYLGYNWFAAISKDNKIYVWHNNKINSVDSLKNIDEIKNKENIKYISSTSTAYAILTKDGKVVCGGSSSSGGNCSKVKDKLYDIRDIYATKNAFAALRKDGTVITWGGSQGGDSSSVEDSLEDIVDIASTINQFSAIKNDGTVIVWPESLSSIRDDLFENSDEINFLATEFSYPVENEDNFQLTFINFPTKPIEVKADSGEITKFKTNSNDFVRYILKGDDAKYFTVDENGVVKFSDEFDSNNAKDSYTLKVVAVDSLGNESEERELIITIKDCNISDKVVCSCGYKFLGEIKAGFAQKSVVVDNYAYVIGARDTLRVIDISNPSSPKQVGYIRSGDEIKDIKIKGNYAYLADGENATGLRVIDISDPTKPKQVGFVSTAGANNIEIKDNYVFMTVYKKGLYIINISEASNPKIVSTINIDKAFDLEVFENYIYVTNFSSELYIVDISDISTPKIVKTIKQYSGAKRMVLTNHYLFIVDNSGKSRIQILDINNPLEPKVVSNIYSIGTSSAKMYIANNKLYVADGFHIQVYDLTEITQPKLFNSYFMVEFEGFPPDSIFVKGDYAYTTHGDRGFAISMIANENVTPIKSIIDFKGETKTITIKDEYAYVYINKSEDEYDGVYIVDISDINSPKILSYVKESGPRGSEIQEIIIKDNYMYLSNGTIYDISNKSYPIKVKDLGRRGRIEVIGNYLFRAEYYYSDAEPFSIIDISNKQKPKTLGSVKLKNSKDIVIKNNYAYVSSSYNGLYIVDISDYTQPKILTKLDVSAEKLAIKGNYLYASYSSIIKVIDINNPLNPKVIQSIKVSDYNMIDSIKINNDYLYVANVTYGVFVVDISEPSNLKIIGHINGLDASRDLAIKNNYLFIVDDESGVSIVDINNKNIYECYKLLYSQDK